VSSTKGKTEEVKEDNDAKNNHAIRDEEEQE
jgi:hypothetical protein